MASASSATFTRNATGLVRQLGFTDALIISLGTINIMGGFVLTMISAPFFFPGANMVAVFLLGAIPAVAFIVMYSILSAAIPRSGGDYVWTGRILGPRAATIMGLLFLFSQIIAFIALNAWGIISYSLAQAFLAFGVSTKNAGLTSLGAGLVSPATGFSLAVIILIIFTAITVFGTRVYTTINRFSFAIYAIILALFIIALATTTKSSFQSNFNSGMASYNLTYSGVQAAVNSNPQLSTFSLYNTILAFPLLGFLTYSGFNFNTYASGETKRVSSTIPRALMVAVGITIVFLFIQAELVYNLMGSTFVNGLSYLWEVGKLGTFPIQPTVTTFLALATNPYLGFAINLGIAIGNFLVGLQCMFMFTRIVFAMSFDRVIPSRLSVVSDRFHSPQYAALVVGVVGIITEYLYWYGSSLLTGYLNSAIAVDVAYMIPGIAAFLFPFVKKDLYNRLVKPLPGWLSATVGGWPLVSIAGLAVTLIWAFGIFTELVPVTAYTYLGASIYYAIAIVLIPSVLAIVLYEGMRAYYKRKSKVDIGLAFKEIPPE
jgi:basic amino acid/polyamine antiporter, APA family